MVGRFAQVAVIVGCLAGIAGSTATATVMVEVPLPKLVAEADLVIHGRVVRTGTQLVRRPDGSLEPHSLTEIRALEVLKGDTRTGAIVTVDEIGGQWQGGGLRIDGTPGYSHGEEVVVFLEARMHGYRTYAMAQGKFSVQHGVPGVPSVARRDLSSIAIADVGVDGTSVQPAAAEPVMQLEALLARVRELSAEGAR